MILISIILVRVYNKESHENNHSKKQNLRHVNSICYYNWLVVSNMFYFHDIWDNPSHWLIFPKMVKTTMLLSLIGTSAAFRPRLVSLISCLLAIGVLFYYGLTAIYVQLVWRSADGIVHHRILERSSRGVAFTS